MTAPTLREDGSVLAKSGYDPTTALLAVLSEDAGEVVPEPGRAEVVGALRELMHPFAGFPLVDADARGGLLAALLTAVVRPALAPAIIEAILAGRQPEGMRLEGLLAGFPDEWRSQHGSVALSMST